MCDHDQSHEETEKYIRKTVEESLFQRLLKDSERKQEKIDTEQKPTFEFDRYPADKLLKAWEEADKTNEDITLEDNELKFSIELDGVQNISIPLFEKFLSQVCTIDNDFQMSCKADYEKKNLSIVHFIHTLAIIYIEEDCISMVYWGTYVNTETVIDLKYESGKWKRMKKEEVRDSIEQYQGLLERV